MTRLTIALGAGAVSLALVLGGCTMVPGSSGGSSASTEGQASPADHMFVMMMIPHHEQAVEMSQILLATEGVPVAVRELAEQIIAVQTAEIELMVGWLDEWGLPSDGSMTGSHTGMGHGGMVAESDIEALEAASGDDAARLYLEHMIEHHEGAIVMAEDGLDGSRDPRVRELEEQVVVTQTAEIELMRRLLAEL